MVQVKVNSFNGTFKELYTVRNYFVVYPIHVGSMQRNCPYDYSNIISFNPHSQVGRPKMWIT